MAGYEQNSAQAWAQQMDMMSHNNQQSAANDETWSNSSGGRPIVPTTLNVEDWYVFLQNGSAGDMSALEGLLGSNAAFA